MAPPTKAYFGGNFNGYFRKIYSPKSYRGRPTEQLSMSRTSKGSAEKCWASIWASLRIGWCSIPSWLTTSSGSCIHATTGESTSTIFYEGAWERTCGGSSSYSPKKSIGFLAATGKEAVLRGSQLTALALRATRMNGGMKTGDVAYRIACHDDRRNGTMVGRSVAIPTTIPTTTRSTCSGASTIGLKAWPVPSTSSISKWPMGIRRLTT